MKILRFDSWQSARHARAAVGVMTVAWAITNATAAAAEPAGDHGRKEHPKLPPPGQHERGPGMGERGPGMGERPNVHDIRDRRGHERDRDAGVAHEHDRDRDRDGGVMHGPHDANHRMPWAARKARYSDLKARQDAGTLSPAEQAELERLQTFEARKKALESTEKTNAENRKKRSQEAKRQALRENPNVGKDPAATEEFRKHAERMAKLERAQALATTDDDKELLQRINTLIGKEQQRHGAWLAQHAAPKGGTAQ
jgi:hypothetical protein